MEEIPITERVILEHNLTLSEYEEIKRILNREPNFTELGIFSVMWSEHCSYKSSRPLLKLFPTEGERILQGPGENAGVIDIGDGLAVVMKIESHNHPSYIEPYQGAATGVGGIIRDIFTMGARPIAGLNSLRFGPLDEPKNRYLFSRVVAGIAGYANCLGLPTVAGEVNFSDSYNGNPLVNVMCVGLVKKDRIFKGRAGGVGNSVMYVGARTGRDGIHGATMASEEFGEGSEERRPTVQVGDPFTEKVLIEACLEVLEKDCIVGIQDMGAAGLTCSSCEMASRGDCGIEIDLSLVPRREEGMIPYEIMLSESQERMLMVVQKGREEEVKEVFAKWDLQAVVIGRVTNDKMLRVKDGGRTVAEMPAKSLADDAPFYNRPSTKPAYIDKVQRLDIFIPEPADYNEVLLKLISSPNIASKSWVYEQYDNMVQTNTVEGPGAEAAVVRVKGTKKALGLTTDGNGRYCYLDPHLGGQIAVAEAARNLSCTGATPIAVTDCLNFGNPEKPESFWQFEGVVKGISLACEKFATPIVGGNVSFYNETEGEAIYPTPVIGMLGLIEDIEHRCYNAFEQEGDIVVLLGETKEELGGSEYLERIHSLVKGKPPKLDIDLELRVQACCREAIANDLLNSACDCSEGGLAIAIAESCIRGDRGAKIELSTDSIRKDALLFGESQSRIVVSLSSEKLESLIELARKHDISLEVIGRIEGDSLNIDSLVDIPVRELTEKWGGVIKCLMEI